MHFWFFSSASRHVSAVVCLSRLSQTDGTLCPVCQTQKGQTDWPFSLSRHVLGRPVLVRKFSTFKMLHTILCTFHFIAKVAACSLEYILYLLLYGNCVFSVGKLLTQIMASAVTPASLAEDSTMTSALTTSPTKKSWLEIRLVISILLLYLFSH